MCNKSIIVTKRNLLSRVEGSFSDSDGNENVKKAMQAYNQNNNSARALFFLVDFFAVTARVGCEIS